MTYRLIRLIGLGLLIAVFALVAPNSAVRCEEVKIVEPPALDKDKKKELKDLIDSYFATYDIPESLKIFNRIRKFDPVCKADLTFFTTYCWQKVAALPKPEKAKGTIKVESPFGNTSVIISGKPPGPKTGFFIGFHGGGAGAGDASESASNWSGMPNCVTAFPNAITLIDNAWNDPPQERFAYWLAKYIRRAVVYDTNRVYCAGHSMGGQGAYGMMLQYADVFISACAGAGNPLIADSQDHYGDAKLLIDSFYNSSIYFYHSADDPRVAFAPVKDWANVFAGLKKQYPEGYDYVFSEYKDNGHGLAKEGLSKCMEWMWTHARNPRPKKIRWRTYRPWKQHFYWLYDLQPKRLDLIEAEYTGKQEVKVTAKDTAGLISVLFNDKLVDPKLPVTVSCNGKQVFSGLLVRSVSAMVASIREYEDPEYVYTSRVDIELP
ncbi:MAG: hypothetical protein WC712_02410 [Candidatus Brocadiia bacterium]